MGVSVTRNGICAEGTWLLRVPTEWQCHFLHSSLDYLLLLITPKDKTTHTCTHTHTICPGKLQCYLFFDTSCFFTYKQCATVCVHPDITAKSSTPATPEFSVGCRWQLRPSQPIKVAEEGIQKVDSAAALMLTIGAYPALITMASWRHMVRDLSH